MTLLTNANSPTDQPLPANTHSRHFIDPPLMRVMVWTGLLLVVMTAVGFGWLMHMVPPPAPSNSKNETLRLVHEHQTAILAGAALCTFFWSFWVTWCAPIVVYIRRMERAPLLTFACIANIGGGAGVITLIAVAWTVMAFRAEDPTVTQLFNDFGFFLFLYTWPSFGILMWLFAAAILRDVNKTEAFPRWVAYYNISAGLTMAPASFMGFFKEGPLAYNGVLAFWVVAIDFFAWMVVMSVMVFKAIAKDEQRQSASAQAFSG